MSSDDTIVAKLVEGTPVDFSSGNATPGGFAGHGWNQVLRSFPFIGLEPLAPDVPVAELHRLTAEARQADPQADIADLSLFFAIRLDDTVGLGDHIVSSLLGLLRTLPFIESAEPASDLDCRPAVPQGPDADAVERLRRRGR